MAAKKKNISTHYFWLLIFFVYTIAAAYYIKYLNGLNWGVEMIFAIISINFFIGYFYGKAGGK